MTDKKTTGASRRVFTKEFKTDIVNRVALLPKGEMTKFLAEHGLTPSHYYQWLKDVEIQKNGGGSSFREAASPSKGMAVELLEQENRRLHIMVEQAALLFEFQKKLQELMAMETSKSRSAGTS